MEEPDTEQAIGNILADSPSADGNIYSISVPICSKCKYKYFLQPAAKRKKYGSIILLITSIFGALYCLTSVNRNHGESDLEMFFAGGGFGALLGGFLWFIWSKFSIIFHPVALSVRNDKLEFQFNNTKYSELFIEINGGLSVKK
jgi:hypothetical protein